MKTLAIIQARMGSTRLPGKVMMNLCGHPMIYWVIKRVTEATLVDKVVVATSTNLENDILAEYVESLGIDVFRGNEKNVLDRYYQCAKQYNPENVVRITGDCPLLYPGHVDLCIKLQEEYNTDYTSNVFPRRTYPRGFDIEVMTYKLLYYIWKQSTTAYEREHVTTYIHKHLDSVKIHNVVQKIDESHHQWSVDTQKDFDRVEKILKRQEEILACINS